MASFIGCSGWAYSSWEDLFYPLGQKAKLRYYSKFFSTVEVDSTFYGMPDRRAVLGWAAQTPPGFLFSAKVPKLITHEKRLGPERGVEQDLMAFLELMRPLREAGKLGALLVQLPPSFRSPRDLKRLEAFLALLPSGPRWAVEFRHPSWWTEGIWPLLERYGVACAAVDAPGLPPQAKVTGGFAYLRLHGRGKSTWYNYLYSEEELRVWSQSLARLSGDAEVVFVYFNNHHRAYAVANALQLLQLLGPLQEAQEAELQRLLALLSPELQREQASPVPSAIPEQLRLLTTEERWARAQQIPQGDIRLEVEGHVARGWVGGYYTYISLNGRVIKHECPDWQKAAEAGRPRLCKHLLAFIARLPPNLRSELASSLTGQTATWRLEARTSF